MQNNQTSSRQSVSVAEKSWKKHPTEDFPISIHYLILDPWFVLEIAKGESVKTIENRARDPKVEGDWNLRSK